MQAATLALAARCGEARCNGLGAIARDQRSRRHVLVPLVERLPQAELDFATERAQMLPRLGAQHFMQVFVQPEGEPMAVLIPLAVSSPLAASIFVGHRKPRLLWSTPRRRPTHGCISGGKRQVEIYEVAKPLKAL